MSSIHILIADDHAVVRAGLKLVLEADDEFTFVGEAGAGVEAVWLAEVLSPPVVLMDLRLSGLAGLNVLDDLRRAALAARQRGAGVRRSAAQAGNAAPDPHHRAATVGRERRGEQGQAQRHDDRR